MVQLILRLGAAATLLVGTANAAFYKIDTPDNIKNSARTLAYDLMLYYKGNQTGEIPGILPGPPSENKGDYYWWEGGAMMGTYIDYWHLTGDTSYNNVVMQGMLHQVGEYNNYMPENHTRSLGNDDQAFWGMSAMLAAEYKFPNPPKDKPQWLALAQAVWNTQADPSRHDRECDGGLRWQIPPFNAGYDYKNTVANGCFFNMGARLARYTGNATYAKHAADTWDWLWEKQYIDHKSWLVYDGATVQKQCKDINKATYSYNAGLLLQGLAFMYDFTKDEKWKTRLNTLLDATMKNFFPDGVAYEVPCEYTTGACTADMLTFKGYMHRWLAQVTQLVPETKDKILPTLRKSTEAAVKQCTGGASQRQCGFYWSSGQFKDPAVDKTSGAGEAMSVLAAVSTLLTEQVSGPVTKDQGGISEGDVNAGYAGHDGEYRIKRAITTADRAGAGIITGILILMCTGMFVWMSFLD